MMKRTLAILLGLALVLGLAPAYGGSGSGDPLVELNKLFDTVTDSSELPDWTGKTLTLRNWYAHGTGDPERKQSKDFGNMDVFSPEIERLFGIKWDVEGSFDNAGMSLQEVIAVRAATGDWPEVAQSALNDPGFVENDLVWDLTDLIPIYMPHYYEILQRAFPSTLRDGYRKTGRLYSISWFEDQPHRLKRIHPDLDISRYQFLVEPAEWSHPMYVRDDILKLAYPHARTQDEIEALYIEKGYFDREDIFDIPLHSRQDVIDFLYKIDEVIKANDIREDGRPVYTTWPTYSYDYWPTLNIQSANMRGLGYYNWAYFMNWNNQTKQMETVFANDILKDDLRMWNQLVRDGVASAEAMLDTQDQFDNKRDNGEYAVNLFWFQPNESRLIEAGKPYRYRKVYMDIPLDMSTYYVYDAERDASGTNSGNLSFFKSQVAEEDLPQILTYLDFLMSDVGLRLQVWGPRSAGLFTEDENGIRRYVDFELEQCMVFAVENNADLKYNLASNSINNNAKFPPSYPMIEVGFRFGGLQNPRYKDYDMTGGPRDAGSAWRLFVSSVYNPITFVTPGPIRGAEIQAYQEIPEVEGFWDVRMSMFEPQLGRCIAAKTDDDFEAAYAELVRLSNEAGLNDDLMRIIEQWIEENLPDDWDARMNSTP